MRRSGDDLAEQIQGITVSAVIGDPVEDANASLNGHASAAEDLGEPRGAHVMKGEVPSDEPRGAHVMKGDPLLSVERRALHAVATQPLAPAPSGSPSPVAALVAGAVPELVPAAPEPATRASRGARRAVRTTKRQGVHATRRRWGLVPVAGAAGALVVGLGTGGAFAYLDAGSAHGSGSGQTTAAGPVTAAITATTVTSGLLPGRTGAAFFTLNNGDPSGGQFDQVTSGATVVSDNTALCPSSDVSIAPTLPYTFSPPITVSAGGASGVQTIPGLVALAPDAPSTCQGVTFTVTLTLSGKSS